MKFKYSTLLIAPFLLLAIFAEAHASIEWTLERAFKLDQSPLDVACSTDGRWVFVLTDEGSLLIYSAEGKLSDRIAVGTHIDSIKAGREAHNLFLVSRKNKTVEEIVLDFIYDIDISGSPFKGKESAPVIITVFNDYQ
jgi:hypothetical protein